MEHTTANLKTSVIKPIHVNWLIATHQVVSMREDSILKGWKETGKIFLLSAVANLHNWDLQEKKTNNIFREC